VCCFRAPSYQYFLLLQYNCTGNCSFFNSSKTHLFFASEEFYPKKFSTSAKQFIAKMSWLIGKISGSNNTNLRFFAFADGTTMNRLKAFS
jgi:hypothetical protein